MTKKILIVAALVTALLGPWDIAPPSASAQGNAAPGAAPGEESFVPPPRRIDDITSILNEPGRFNKSVTLKFKSGADAAQPADETTRGLAAFYRSRAIAAWQLGRYQQTIDDAARAEQYGSEAGVMDPELRQFLGVAEMDAGNFKKAIELFKLNIARSGYIGSYQMLVAAYAQVGDLDEAKRVREEALASCDEPRGRTRARFNKRQHYCEIMRADTEARLLEAQGKYAEAEKFIRDSIHQSLTLQMEESSPGTILRRKFWLSRNLGSQEKFFESEVAAREVLRESLSHGGQESAQTINALMPIANALAAQGRVEEAERLLSTAIRILEESGFAPDSRIGALVRAAYGAILTARGEFKEAVGQFDALKAGLSRNEYLYQKSFSGNPSLLLSLIMTGRAGEAMGRINGRYERLRTLLGETNFSTAFMRALRGMALRRLGEREKAVEDFSRSIDILMESSLERGGYLKTLLVKIVIMDYMELLDGIRTSGHGTGLKEDPVSTMFRLSEMLRDQTVQNALLASSARSAETDPRIVKLIRDEQDLLRQIEVTETAILENVSIPADQQDPRLVARLQEKLKGLRQSRGAALAEVRKGSARYASFVAPLFPTAETVRGHLKAGEVFISIYSGGTKTYVWAIPHGGRVHFASLPVARGRLEKSVSTMRESLDCSPLTVKDIPEFNTSLSYELYHSLLHPVKEGWKEGRDLIFAVNDPLNRIPLATLVTSPFTPAPKEKVPFEGYRKASWLVLHHSVTMVPSASSLLALRTLPSGKAQRRLFVGFGDPIFSLARSSPSAQAKDGPVQVRSVRLSNRGGLDSDRIVTSQLETLSRLPDTAEELAAIAETLKADRARDLFLGKEASRMHVKAMDLSDRKIIAFATHALVPGDLDGLDQPALALSSPAVTGVKGDGLLTMDDVMKLKLNSDWVVLSACNTGSSAGSGAEALSGLGRAFFYAGTRAVLATMYPVETTSARKLTTRLFNDLSEHHDHTRAQALRRAMTDLINDRGYVDPVSGKVAASYAHPLFWAPFILFGEGGR